MKTALLLAALLSSSVAIAVPVVISHEGRLLDAGDQPVSGHLALTFRIWAKSRTNGEWVEAWKEIHDDVLVNVGMYAVTLGGGTTLSGALFDDDNPLYYPERELGVQVAALPELTPRLKTGASIYALKAGDAEKLGGKAPAYYATAAALEAQAATTAAALEAQAATNAATYLPKAGGAITGNLAVSGSVDVGSGKFVVAANGKVGVGTNAPAAQLDVAGSVNATAFTGGKTADWNTAYAERNTWDGSAAGLDPAMGRDALGLGALATKGSVASNTIDDGTIANVDLAAGTFSAITGVGTLGALNVTGNVGIGTTSPTRKLQVEGLVRSDTGFIGEGGTLKIGTTSASRLDLVTADAARISIAANGSVGIGTLTPRSGLDTGRNIVTGAANDYEKAQFNLSGGGTVDWAGPGGRLKWSSRFISLPVARPDTSASGYIDFVQPKTDIPASNVYDGAARSATTAGVLLNDWEGLYAAHTVGGDQAAVSYFIVRYTNNFVPPSNWIMIAAVNSDDATVKLGTGVTLRKGERYAEGMHELPRPIIWSGGCSSHGTGSGWNTYCTNATDFTTAADYISAAPDGTITFLRGGFYKISFYWIAYGSAGGSAHGRFLKNGNQFYYSHNNQALTNNWFQQQVEQTWPFNAGDTLIVQANNSGSYAYHSYNSQGSHSRLQVSFAGQL